MIFPNVCCRQVLLAAGTPSLAGKHLRLAGLPAFIYCACCLDRRSNGNDDESHIINDQFRSNNDPSRIATNIRSDFYIRPRAKIHWLKLFCFFTLLSWNRAFARKVYLLDLLEYLDSCAIDYCSYYWKMITDFINNQLSQLRFKCGISSML